MARKKVLLTTNPPWLMTGLAENGKFLARWLARTGKYDLAYYASQSAENDPNHSRMPWRSHGCIPADPAIQHQLNQDPGRARLVAYGAYYIDRVVKEEKPDILWCSDDIWSFQGDFVKASWWPQIHSFLHVTVDSLPILDFAYEQARSTPHYYTWARFAATEMKQRGKEYGHVKSIYGATDVNNFAPLSASERRDLRRRFKLSETATIFGYTFRNQLRKEALNILMAFAEYKKEHRGANVKLHLHTSWSEIANGWDFPRWIKYLGIDANDVLCTYVCKQCGGWHVRPYGGEDIDCPLCGAKKSNVTASIAHGVPADEMKLLYGIRDATISPLTSGGLEYENVNTLLCGLPLATTNYSAGADFCEQPFVYPITWHRRAEAGTSFVKATNDVGSIKLFIDRIHKMATKDREAIGEQSRAWAAKTFSIETIGPQWEAAFDALPPRDWSSITLSTQLKNTSFPMPQVTSTEAFVRALYKGILLVDPDPEGLRNWMTWIDQGKMTHQQVYAQFIQIGHNDNAKHTPPQDFGVLFDKTNRKRILFVMKESGGDVFIATALFKGLKDLYPDADLYFASEPRFHEIVVGNEYVHKVLAYHPAMDNELLMRQYVDYYYWPAVATQVRLNYLTHERIGLNLNEPRGITLADCKAVFGDSLLPFRGLPPLQVDKAGAAVYATLTP